MKKIIHYFFVVLILALTLFIYRDFNRNNPVYIIKSLRLQDRLLSEHMKAEFRVFFAFFPFGSAQIKNEGIEDYRNTKVYHLSAQAQTEGLISRFYSPRFRVDTYVDKEKMHSLKFEQFLDIPDKPVEKKEIIYDQRNNIMELRGERRHILPDTQDPLSAIFYIQRQGFSLGKEFDININTNQKNYRLNAKVVKKEEYNIGGKKIGVWVVQADISRRDKNPLHSSAMSLYFLDNPSKTLILIKSVTSIGLVRARLVKIE